MTQKHYTHQADIFRAIRKANAKRDDFKRRIADLEPMRKAYAQAGLQQLAQDFEGSIKKLERQIERIENVRLKQLQNTLAAFNTKTFDFMDGVDIVTQKV